ncbi:unnamed protein product [Taenia asiatica]|uniref:Endo/exonuclease/phosphatase domain-containing protein n=1 Tax=Taenia asiatica TaxID=60517 RepID=A0A3P6QDI2_TAEAS|nr:unnamed protein product [Taenia asiatica]
MRVGVLAVHISPKAVKMEMEALHDVAPECEAAADTQNLILLGDMNADCGYLSKRDRVGLRLRTDHRYKWLIQDGMDTTVAESNCTYDSLFPRPPIRFCTSMHSIPYSVVLSALSAQRLRILAIAAAAAAAAAVAAVAATLSTQCQEVELKITEHRVDNVKIRSLFSSYTSSYFDVIFDSCLMEADGMLGQIIGGVKRWRPLAWTEAMPLRKNTEVHHQIPAKAKLRSNRHNAARRITLSANEMEKNGVIVKGSVLDKRIPSACPYNFDKVYDLPPSKAKRVSDHYPVEFEIN